MKICSPVQEICTQETASPTSKGQDQKHVFLHALPAVKKKMADSCLPHFQIKRGIHILFLNKNIFCGYSLEAPQRGASIRKTHLYHFDPLKPHFYIVKLRFTGVYIIFLISQKKHRLWVLVRTAIPWQF